MQFFFFGFFFRLAWPKIELWSCMLKVWWGFFCMLSCSALPEQTLIKWDENTQPYPITPFRKEPALGTRPHITVLNVIWPQLHVTLLIINNVPKVADTFYIPGLLANSTWNRALKTRTNFRIKQTQNSRIKGCFQVTMLSPQALPLWWPHHTAKIS